MLAKSMVCRGRGMPLRSVVSESCHAEGIHSIRWSVSAIVSLTTCHASFTESFASRSRQTVRKRVLQCSSSFHAPSCSSGFLSLGSHLFSTPPHPHCACKEATAQRATAHAGPSRGISAYVGSNYLGCMLGFPFIRMFTGLLAMGAR